MTTIATPFSSLGPTIEFPSDNISWKGRTLYQIVSTVQKNTNGNAALPLYFHANPVTLYRREIANTLTKNTCNENTSLRLSVMDAPGGSVIVSTATRAATANGVIATVDPIIPNNTGLIGTACTTCNNNSDNCLTSQTANSNVCFSQQYNARRRCRSGGMIQKRFRTAHNNDNAYFTDQKQYLTSRNRTIAQNEYNYIRQGNSLATPGTNASTSNVYSAGGLSHCRKYKIAAALSNNTFSYIWLNGTTYTVTIPDGNYDIYDFNAVFSNTMITNGHYYTNKTTGARQFLLQWSYSLSSGTVELDVYATLSSNNAYTKATAWTDTYNSAQVVIGLTALRMGLGFAAGTYPASPVSANTAFYGTTNAPLQPPYVPMYYNPSNSQFAVQGSVTSSERTLRRKYNNVQTAAGRTTTALGAAVGNSMAYGVPVPDYGNTIKDKLGFPNICTPVIKVYDNGWGIRNCTKFMIRSR